MHILRLMAQLSLLCVLIGPLSALFTASCSQPQPAAADILRSGFAELRSNAGTVIADPDRRETFIELSRQLESELLAFDDYAAGFVNDYRAGFTDYASSQSALIDRSEAFRQRQRAMQDRFVDLHLAMAATATPREWQLLSDSEAEIIRGLLSSAQASLR